MKYILILLLTLLPILTTAQQGGVSPQDAARLDKIWKAFVDGIARRDTALLNAIALPTLACKPCAATADTSVFLSAPAFFAGAFTWPGKPFWQAVTSQKYWVNTIVTSSRPQNVLSGQKHFVIYELSFVTTAPNVIAPGHEGISHLFQFIDLGGTFKFYGLATVP